MYAKHIKSGHEGEIQDTYVSDYTGETVYYFEDHARPTVAGWYFGRDLAIPGVTA